MKGSDYRTIFWILAATCLRYGHTLTGGQRARSWQERQRVTFEVDDRAKYPLPWDYYWDPDIDAEPPKGLFPDVFNLAANAVITANATCGETGPETYCRLVEHVQMREPHCDTCDAISQNPDHRHPISQAIDGANKWWQSPSLQNGPKYQWVTITLDLKQMFQIAYVILKTGPSPRPGNWILERSVDGVNYRPWQYYGMTDGECWDSFMQRPTVGPPKYRFDDEVICTSYYSKLDPLEGAEIHTSLINGRPGIDGPSQTLSEFTRARYIRLRLQKIRTLNADLMSINGVADRSVTRRYFYTIKDISIGGQCVCSGHAKDCPWRPESGKLECKCEHNTCGDSCDRCCPLYNQKPWRAGTNNDGAVCEQCQCYGHADECAYDPKVADERTSLNIEGKYEGGGVCVGCRSHTTGVNCQRCENGYYRPLNVHRNHPNPCKPCKCSGPGISGLCIEDDSHLAERLYPGDCLCKKGFTGKKCEHCAPGYRNYPLCEACPCNHAGSLDPKVCEGACRCKKNVEGLRCDTCRPGFYNLDPSNPDGCSPCYCFGITDKCDSSDWGIELVKSLPDWKVTDIRGTKLVRPTFENGKAIIANDDMTGVDDYYWRAPPNYLGKKLYSYGGDLKFTTSYFVDRGDTSGRYTEVSDVIMEGEDVMIGYSWGKQKNDDNTTINLPLREQNWFILNPDGTPGEPVNREIFTKVLNNLNRLLIRAKFHTDQIEATLYDVEMETASKESNTIRKMTGVEHCQCPIGYTGLSCEMCSTGYRRINGGCERCDCNNHAESCDIRSGQCRNCLHFTTGVKCERCLPGYYGNPNLGTPYDCKKCACPLEIDSNNFSPTCNAVTTDGRKDYVCNNCARGYAGDKCERCTNGYFGNPMTPGGYCQPCECGDEHQRHLPGYCDSVTGKCMRCVGNTGGWNCNECLPGHFGNPASRNCRPCTCSKFGSESNDCDKTIGQCICKPNFVGISCDRCADGYGNVELGCIPCRCHPVGSESQNCDPVNGQCRCKPGVFGTRCDQCLEAYYGFSNEGCKYCKCDPNGAMSLQCDEITGQCRCKPYISGRMCDKCQDGYWNLISEKGCELCNCNYTGSISNLCNQLYGQCNCKPGVGNKHCDACLPGHYGFSPSGCKKCDPCDVPGRTCDPKNGRCVCPPFTTGKNCQRCAPVAWGYDPSHGCKPCECNPQGSERQECDPSNGHCTCLEGFEGRKCDKCRYGFYRFPNCKRCKCNLDGTQLSNCSPGPKGHCQCDESGQCPCKENVDGKKCERCRESTFGLSSDNSKGCFTCFCFGKTPRCDQASVFWSQVVLTSRTVRMSTGDTQLTSLHGLKVIPGLKEDITVGIPYVLDQPLYWALPDEFLGDKVSAYNGNISFRIDIHSNSRFPDALLEPYPLLLLQGNHRLVLTHHHFKQVYGGYYTIRLHESEWQQHNNPHLPVTREIMMVALQNLQHILVRSTEGPDVKYTRISNVSMQVADKFPSGQSTPQLAKGVEVCQCPPQYTGLSCQDPAPGYYRKRKPNYLDSKDILDLVGWSEACPCNNRSRTCDPETGLCFNCTGNTGGPYCSVCNKGYYGDPAKGCRRCACPTATSSFSDSCRPEGLDYVCTNCQAGYGGRHCETCADGYYGDPLGRGGRTCQPCNCNTYGSRSQTCDKVTGQCDCLEGITGKDCTRCLPRYFLTAYGCKSCNDNCTGILLDEVDFLMNLVERTNLSGVSPVPWGQLFNINNNTLLLNRQLEEYIFIISNGKQLLDNVDLTLNLDHQRVQLMRERALDARLGARKSAEDAIDVREEAYNISKALSDLYDKIQDRVEEIRRHGAGSGHTGHHNDLMEAEAILKELRARSFDLRQEEAERELRLAQALLNLVKNMTSDTLRADDLEDKLKLINERLAEFRNIIKDRVMKPSLTARQHINEGTKYAKEIKYALDKSKENLQWSNDTLKEASDILARARDAVLESRVNFEMFPRIVKELDDLIQELEEKRGILDRLNPEYLKKYVLPAQDHADKLQKQADGLTKLFNAAEKDSRAANAYNSIVAALNAAKEAADRAKDAAEKAYDEAYPGTDDALTAQARAAKELSQRLLEEANALNMIKVPELKTALERKKKVIFQITRNLDDGATNLDKINAMLDSLPKGGLKDKLREAEDKHRGTMGKLDRTHGIIDDINDRIARELGPRVHTLGAGSAEGLDNITKIIDQARADIRVSNKKAGNAEVLSKKVSKLKATMDLNLKELRDKILLAKQKASTIKVSLSANEQNQCVRSYRPEVEPTTFNNIVLNYAIKSEARDSLLFFLGSSKKVPEGVEPDDFMAIEMHNRSIRFVWNAGGGTQTLQHKGIIETNDQQLLKNNQWYKIEVTRVGNFATLSVKRTPDGQTADPDEVSKSSAPGFSKMDIDKDSYFYVGGLPSGYKAPRDLKTNSFAGCLHEVYLDGKRVGLWNFLTNKGCDACKEGATEEVDTTMCTFKGDGYVIIPQIGAYSERDNVIAMHFKTFDEDALLFFSPNPVTGDYISLELHRGQVVYRFREGNRPPLIITTQKKYNTGQWVKLTAQRQLKEGMLIVGDEEREAKAASEIRGLLKLGKSQLYFGGIPPNFTTANWPLLNFHSFLGCVQSIQLDMTPINLLSQGSSYNIEPGCVDKVVKVVAFKGSGYVELNGQPLAGERESSFGFTFQTAEPDALLMISTFEGQDEQTDRSDSMSPKKKGKPLMWSELLKHYYSISLVNGRLEGRFASGDKDAVVNTEVEVNDGRYHTVTVVRQNRRIILSLNDDELGRARLPKGSGPVLVAPTKGGLFFGGVPERINIGNMAGSRKYLKGTIKDAVFNGKLLRFNEPVSFESVGIGRTIKSQIHNQMSSHPPGPPYLNDTQIERCADMEKFSVEDRAVKFGDAIRSHAKLSSISKKLFTRNFNITFEFRTYFPNGIILYLKNGRKMSYFVVYLEKGFVHVATDKSKLGAHLVSDQGGLNDGLWHAVTLVKKGPSLHVRVNSDSEEKILDVRKKLGVNPPLYIGGVPESIKMPSNVMVRESFKGCVRQFRVNDNYLDIASGDLENVNQCFAKIERGAYFSGDGHAIYSSNFNLGSRLTLSMEFKTTKLNGILISLSDPSGAPSMALELQNGKIIATVNTGSSLGTFSATKSFHSKYEMCDGKWHSVKLYYTKNSITLKVDSYEVAYGLSRNGNAHGEPRTSSPLYIGGIPDYANMGSLHVRNNFVGCLNNISFNEERVDWRDMAFLHNVLPNSCPLF